MIIMKLRAVFNEILKKVMGICKEKIDVPTIVFIQILTPLFRKNETPEN